MQRVMFRGLILGALLAAWADQSAQAAAPATPQGYITFRTYDGDQRAGVRAGTAAADGVYHPKRAEGPYNGFPDDDLGDDETLPKDNYRERYNMELIGYFYPPKTGKIQFAIATDDPGELWFSTDDNPANKVQIASETNWNPRRNFLGGDPSAPTRRTITDDGKAPSPRPQNMSPYISVVAGKPYWIQSIGTEFGGGDNNAIAFRYEGDPDFEDATSTDTGKPIAGKYLSTIDLTALDAVFVSSVTGNPGGFVVNVHDSVEGGNSLAATGVKVSLDGADVTVTATKSGASTALKYAKASGFLTAGAHKVVVTGKDSKGRDVNANTGFTIANFVTLKASDKITPDTTKPGFFWNVHQNNGVGTGNSNARTKNQLSGALKDSDGNPWPNLADPNAVGGADAPAASPNPAWAPISFTVSQVINFSQVEGENNGTFRPDLQMPGIPSLEGNADSIAAEIITFIELPAGATTMGVNSDDGFETSVGQSGDVFFPPQVAGAFSGGRGAADTTFTIVADEAGVYPFRTIWEEGGGGANIEWFTLKADGTKVLVNDTASGGLKAYRVVQPTAKKAVGRKVSPAPNSGGAAYDTSISVELVDGGSPIASSSVSLKFDGAPVTATVTKAADVTTITYKPASLLAPKSTHTVELAFTEAGSAQTRQWKFTTLNTDLIAYWDFNDASNPKQAKDKVGGWIGTMESGAKYTDDGKGRSGKAGDRAAKTGSMDPAVNGWILVSGPDVKFMNAGAIQNQMAVSFWQRLDETKNSSAFWSIGDGQDRAFQAHVPWGDKTIYFDTGGGCCDGSQRVSKNIADLAGADPETFFLQWHHFVFQKNNDTKQIWIDGALYLEGVNNSPLTTSFTSLWIGSQAGNANPIHGDIDDFAMFASALTPAEISRLSKGEAPDAIRAISVAAAKFTKFSKNADGTLTIEWTGGGTLEASPSVTGPWQAVAGATSPYTFKPSTAILFGRIKN